MARIVPVQYNVLEARNQLSKLIDAAAAGEEVVIAKRGKPTVKLVKVDDEPPLGSAERLRRIFERFPPVPARTQREIDEEIRWAKSGWRDELDDE